MAKLRTPTPGDEGSNPSAPAQIESLVEQLRQVVGEVEVDAIVADDNKVPLTFLATIAKQPYAVKLFPSSAYSRYSRELAAYRDKPLPKIPRPELHWHGVIGDGHCLVINAPTRRTLHDVVASCSESSLATRIWAEVLDSASASWTDRNVLASTFESDIRPFQTRVQRIFSFLRETRLGGEKLEDQLNQVLFVNGIRCGQVGEILENLSRPPITAVKIECHGDVQPTNILVAESGAWCMIDWEWYGWPQDVLLSLSVMIGWWYVRHTQYSGLRVFRTPGQVHVTYERSLDSTATKMLQTTTAFAARVCNALPSALPEEINKYVGLYVVGSARFQSNWGRRETIDCVLADGLRIAAIEAPLLGGQL